MFFYCLKIEVSSKYCKQTAKTAQFKFEVANCIVFKLVLGKFARLDVKKYYKEGKLDKYFDIKLNIKNFINYIMREHYYFGLLWVNSIPNILLIILKFFVINRIFLITYYVERNFLLKKNLY